MQPSLFTNNLEIYKDDLLHHLYAGGSFTPSKLPDDRASIAGRLTNALTETIGSDLTARIDSLETYSRNDLFRIYRGVMNSHLDYINQDIRVLFSCISQKQVMAFYYGVGVLFNNHKFPDYEKLNHLNVQGILNYFMKIYNSHHKTNQIELVI